MACEDRSTSSVPVLTMALCRRSPGGTGGGSGGGTGEGGGGRVSGGVRGGPRKRRRGDKARAKRAARKRQRSAAKRRRRRRSSAGGRACSPVLSAAADAAAALLGEALVGKRIRVAVLRGIGDGDDDSDGNSGSAGTAEEFRWVAATVCAYSARSGQHRVRLHTPEGGEPAGQGESADPDPGNWLLLEESPVSLASSEDEPVLWELMAGSVMDNDDSVAAAPDATSIDVELPRPGDPGWSDFAFVKEQFSAAHGYGGWALEFASEALRADPELLRLATETSGDAVLRFASTLSSTSETSTAAAASVSGAR